jgi:hypothetical protein
MIIEYETYFIRQEQEVQRRDNKQPEWIFMPGRAQLVYKMYIFERPIFNI